MARHTGYYYDHYLEESGWNKHGERGQKHMEVCKQLGQSKR